MPNSYSKDSSTPVEPDSITEPISQVEEIESTPRIPPKPPVASDDATEVFVLANGYEYVTADSGSQRAVIDTEDDSLTLGLMKNGEEFEKLTRRERRADRFAERVAALDQAQAEEERLRVASQTGAAERDRLAPVAPLIQEPVKRKLGSKVFFVGSAALTAAAAVVAVALLLPGQGGSSQPASGTSVAPSSSSAATTNAPAPTSVAPTPSFNTQAPTVTEQQTQESAVTPGTVQYATTDPVPEAPVEETVPEPIVTVEPAPTEAEEVTLEPTESPSAPAEITPPADASPIDEPERPIETPDPGESAGVVVEETPVDPSPAPVEEPTAAASPSEPAVIAIR